MRRPCASLTVEQRQIVEIARALASGTRVPAARRADRGAGARTRCSGCSSGSASSRPAGVAVLYISHHLEEVFEICQDVAVIRDGEIVLSAATADV